MKSLLLYVCPNSFRWKLNNIAFSSLRSPTTFENALSLSIDGDQLEPDRSNFIQKPGSIFTLIKVPLQKSDISTRVRRDRPNRQRACSHRIVCQAGDHILEKMKILPVCKSNFLALCFNFERLKYIFRYTNACCWYQTTWQVQGAATTTQWKILQSFQKFKHRFILCLSFR